MTVEDFPEFYKAIHGYRPFDWQEQLLTRVVAEGWPSTISLPTSSGKTSAIDIAVFHLALQAGLKMQERSAALRTFFVIDRRVVVDEASEHAGKIANALLGPGGGILAEVAAELSRYGGEVPLEVSTMRGGMYRDNSWADEPNQPLICVSTVDQVGSRLLFRGYQVGESSRPVHAGLIGNDSLIIVDEAHLSTAFLDTLGAVQSRYGKWADCPPAKQFRVVQMSATIDRHNTFHLEPESVAKDALLANRLNASKPAELRIPKKRFEDEMIAAAKDLTSEPGARVVGVIVNTVGAARQIFTELRKQADAVLLVGRNRPYCAQQLWEKYKPRIAAQPGRQAGPLLFVVATQTVEVGANIDFDVLVTECAPLDSLRQRFGRLNRLGKPGVSKAAIVLRPKGDVVYGATTDKTWKFLTKRAPVDFGVTKMDLLVKGHDLKSLNSVSDRGPLLFPAHFEFWIQTNPTPSPDPDVAPFLHGEKALDAADVQVVWRRDLNGVDSPMDWADLVELAPPLAAEALPLPIAAVKRWLKGQAQEVTDVEGIAIVESKEEKRDKGRPALRWRGPGKSEPKYAGEIRPGDTIVVPTTYDGADEYGWYPDFPKTEDIGDKANNAQAALGMRRPRIRVDLLDVDREKITELIKRLQGTSEEDPDPSAREELENLLPEKFEGGLRVDSLGKIITWPLQTRESRMTSPAPEETDEDDKSSFIGKPIPLNVHVRGVEKRARRYAEGCGLDPKLIEDIVLAAHLHDLGKCDERFQSWLRGGRFAGGEFLAKSGERRTRSDDRRIQQAAGYPKGARHEAASVLAAGALGLVDDAHDRDLVLYLIGVHHGSGRPFFPVWQEDPDYRFRVESDGVSAQIASGCGLARIDSGWIDRFWNLNRRYGYWGLALLEGILRRADCMQSRQEELCGPN